MVGGWRALYLVREEEVHERQRHDDLVYVSAVRTQVAKGGEGGTKGWEKAVEGQRAKGQKGERVKG
jgi:hypothetical protein